jgi:Rrf2 family protein
MATEEEKEIFRSKELCENLNIPYKYLTSVITNLSKANIIKSTKGRSGGISFAKKLNDIKLNDIINVTESSDIEDCIMGFGVCDETKKCSLHDSWKAPKNSVINDFLSQTLLDIKQKSN